MNIMSIARKLLVSVTEGAALCEAEGATGEIGNLLPKGKEWQAKTGKTYYVYATSRGMNLTPIKPPGAQTYFVLTPGADWKKVEPKFGTEGAVVKIEAGPSASDVNALVQAYGKKLGSQIASAPIPIQQRFHNQFNALLQKLVARYPDVDMKSDAFQASLEVRAKKWWDSRAMRGVGVDW